MFLVVFDLYLPGCVLLVGGTGIDAKPLREVWKADAPMPIDCKMPVSVHTSQSQKHQPIACKLCCRFRPTSWSQTTDEAMWPDAAYALWVPLQESVLL